jgi:hypothetical protein
MYDVYLNDKLVARNLFGDEVEEVVKRYKDRCIELGKDAIITVKECL